MIRAFLPVTTQKPDGRFTANNFVRNPSWILYVLDNDLIVDPGNNLMWGAHCHSWNVLASENKHVDDRSIDYESISKWFKNSYGLEVSQRVHFIESEGGPISIPGDKTHEVKDIPKDRERWRNVYKIFNENKISYFAFTYSMPVDSAGEKWGMGKSYEGHKRYLLYPNAQGQMTIDVIKQFPFD